jgi:sugar phosphate isomerase/epimerase
LNQRAGAGGAKMSRPLREESVKYSYDALVYHGEKIAKSFERVARYGYDAIELVGEPANHDVAEIRALSAKHKIKVSSLCSIFFGAERDLVAAEPENRAKAKTYVRDLVDFAAAIDCPMVIIRPAPFGKTSPTSDEASEWAWAVEGIRESADYGAGKNIKFCIEAWNRYETYFGNTLDQVLKLRDAVDRPNVGVMGDSFHMAIEEKNLAEAYRRAGLHLFHVHFADSNRAAPGAGHTDFEPILRALKDIGYGGYIAFELLPAAADVFGTLQRGGGKEFFDDYTKMAVETCKAIEARIGA